MNSSTSTSEPPPVRDGIRLGVLAGALVVLLGGLAGFNAWQDPFGAFGGKALIFVVSGTHANAPLKALLELKNGSSAQWQRADVAFVGDSRGRQLSTERFETFEGHSVVNLSCGGATLEESLTLLALHAKLLSGLKTLILCAPLERFTEAAAPNRCDEAKPLADFRLRYLLNWQITQDSWTLLSTPQLTKAQRSANAPQKQEEVNRAVARAWLLMYQGQTPAQVQLRLEMLRQYTAPLRERGVQLVLWRPPLQGKIQELIQETQVQPIWDGLLPSLQKLGYVVDFTSAKEIEGHPFSFSDPVHTTDSPALLRQLLRASE